MGLDASAQAAIAAAAVAVAAWLVSLVQILLTWRWRQQDREHALSDRQKDRDAAIQDRKADQQAAQQQRQGDRQAAIEDRQRDRIAALNSHYQSAVQPAVALLLALKQQANDGALWTALMAIGQQPPAAAAAAAAAAGPAPQLVLPHGVAAEEHKARNLAKGFWEDLISAMADNAVPPSFGTAEPGDYGAVHFAATDDGERWFERANNFRELVEPFDIVKWYRSGLHDRTGRHYTQGTIRPAIFQRLQDMKVRQLRSQPTVPGAAQHMYMNSMVWAHAQAGSVPAGSGSGRRYRVAPRHTRHCELHLFRSPRRVICKD